jgi:hypothetical protein
VWAGQDTLLPASAETLGMSSEDERAGPRLALAAGLVILGLVGCTRAGTSAPPEQALPQAADLHAIPERYAFLYDARALFSQPEELWESLPLASISLERTGCYGTCPQYSVRFEHGGLAGYDGRDFAPQQGRWTGDVGLYGFGMLCFLVERLRFEQLRDSYAASWTDDETVIVTVEWGDGRSKTVRDYGRHGPPELFALQRVIDSLADEIEWQPAPRGGDGGR